MQPMQQPMPHAAAPQAYPGAGAPQAYPGAGAPVRQPKRNFILIGIGLFALLIAFLVFCLFAYNLWQYMTVEDRFQTLPSYSRDFAVRIVQRAAEKRMMVFGPISGFFGLVGLVLAGLGLRKK